MFVSGYQHHRTNFANLDLIEANPYGVHDAINDLHRRAARLAPRFYEDTADAGCTNLRPTSGRRQQVWDMLAEALAWNMISDHAELVAAAVAWLRQGLEVTAGADYQSPGQVLFVTSSDGRKVVWTDRIHQVCTAYNEAGIAWATSGGKVWPADSAYDAECEPCVKGFAHIHPAPQAPLFEVVAEVAYDEATDALVPQDALQVTIEYNVDRDGYDWEVTAPGGFHRDGICHSRQNAEDLAAQAVATALVPDGDGQFRCPECDTYSGSFTISPGPDYLEVVHSLCGRAGSPASFVRGTPEADAAYGDDDEDDSVSMAAWTFAQALSTQAWTDLAPHLTCREAEAAAEFLRAVDQDATAIRLLEAHGASDEEGDAHWQA